VEGFTTIPRHSGKNPGVLGTGGKKMRNPPRWLGRVFGLSGVVGVLVCLMLSGCHRSAPSVGQASAPSSSAGGSETCEAFDQSAKSEPRLHQSFAEATLADQPDQYLPETTLAGKSVGKLYEAVMGRWGRIAFLNSNGQKLAYTATLETELGIVAIDLWPDVAPNHVRNFVALAQSGYFDGLVFERIIRDQSHAEPKSKLELIEGGCPTGKGHPGYGSIGYWLRPEFSKNVHHEEGTVGACLDEDPNTAACRFYITLSKAPAMDGERTIFGKVSRGLDVVRRIATQPVVNSPEYPQGDRPERPVVIRKVTIQVSRADHSSEQHAAR
jgi:cyclophilin family peptidyl-prolyl cis-trans isomerase